MKEKPIKSPKSIGDPPKHYGGIRKTWAINPRTRIKKSKMIYSRQKLKQEAKRINEHEK